LFVVHKRKEEKVKLYGEDNYINALYEEHGLTIHYCTWFYQSKLK